MLISGAKAGDRAEIYPSKEKLSGRFYVSQVEALIPDSGVLLRAPVSYGQTVKLPASEEYSVIFFTDKGMFSYEARIAGFSGGFMRLSLTSAGERVQRRGFFRFNCLLPLKFQIKGGEPKAYLDGVIKDIGGGGFKCVANAEMDERLEIKAVIMLRDELLRLNAKILHRLRLPEADFKYQYRAEFLGITQEEQDKIIRYIFNEERNQTR